MTLNTWPHFSLNPHSVRKPSPVSIRLTFSSPQQPHVLFSLSLCSFSSLLFIKSLSFEVLLDQSCARNSHRFRARNDYECKNYELILLISDKGNVTNTLLYFGHKKLSQPVFVIDREIKYYSRSFLIFQIIRSTIRTYNKNKFV